MPPPMGGLGGSQRRSPGCWGISSLRAWLQDGTQLLERQAEVGEGRDPQFSDLRLLLAMCCEKNRRRREGSSAGLWGQGPTALMG